MVVGNLFPSISSNLEKGLDRLCLHFSNMFEFFDSQHVFAVVLHNMSYGKPNDYPGSNRRQVPAADPIQELREAIPRTYLHIPHSFDFRIGNSSSNREKIVFHYWTQRMVELSSFTVKLNDSVLWHDEENHHFGNTYKLRVFVGFDRFRINDSEAGKAGSLYIYSRQSGRLIKHEPDARFLLGLSTGGSTYCSGLTVLIDDIRGMLPLNPTKQDIGFGEQGERRTFCLNRKSHMYIRESHVNFLIPMSLSKWRCAQDQLVCMGGSCNEVLL